MNMENTYYILKGDLVTKIRHIGTQTESASGFDGKTIRKVDKEDNETENLKKGIKEDKKENAKLDGKIGVANFLNEGEFDSTDDDWDEV